MTGLDLETGVRTGLPDLEHRPQELNDGGRAQQPCSFVQELFKARDLGATIARLRARWVYR